MARGDFLTFVYMKRNSSQKYLKNSSKVDNDFLKTVDITSFARLSLRYIMIRVILQKNLK